MKDAFYWKGQIANFKSDNKNFFSQAKKCEEAYCDSKSYNIFYSNVQLLKAYLLTNDPKPEVERRFLKKVASDKLQYNTYLELANVLEGALSFYTDKEDFRCKLKRTIEEETKVGRGVLWVTYEPTISKVKDELGNVQEVVTGRELKIDFLGYEDYACSTSINKEQIWWKARRHLLGKEELKAQFNYEAQDEELNFTTGKDTDRKLAEVWEIWDKTEKKRVFILAQCVKNEFLKEDDDPYGISTFFPCDDLTELTNGKDIIPIPEYELYRKKAVELNKVSALADMLEEKVKFVITTDKTNQDNVLDMANAGEGDIVTLQTPNPMATGNNGAYLGFLPIKEAVELLEHREIKKAQLKQDIYDITGIADIMRGQTDPNETATAQQIKGVFGTLRFQDRQKQVQDFVVSIFEIIAEIICENWDAETLQDITSTYLPSEEEKMQIQAKIAQLQVMQSNPQYMLAVQQGTLQLPQVTKEEFKTLEQPTWDMLIQIMRDDKLRNYSIDVQSSATVFDDLAEQSANVQQLAATFKDIVMTATQIQSPAVIRGYIPIAKMQLTNIKVGRAIAKQLIDSLEEGAEELERSLGQQEADPKAMLAQQELALKQADLQRKIAVDKQEAVDKTRDFAIREAELKGRMLNEAEKNRIKEQEEQRKQEELEAQYALKRAELQHKVNIDTNIAGDVRTLE
jgi:L-rhamnose mutarotase